MVVFQRSGQAIAQERHCATGTQAYLISPNQSYQIVSGGDSGDNGAPQELIELRTTVSGDREPCETSDAGDAREAEASSVASVSGDNKHLSCPCKLHLSAVEVERWLRRHVGLVDFVMDCRSVLRTP